MKRKRENCGARWSQNGNPTGAAGERRNDLTEPKGWPYQAANMRDESAEHVNDAIVLLQGLLDGRAHDEKEVIVKVAQVNYHLMTALRWLEAAGASTRPVRRG